VFNNPNAHTLLHNASAGGRQIRTPAVPVPATPRPHTFGDNVPFFVAAPLIPLIGTALSAAARAFLLASTAVQGVGGCWALKSLYGESNEIKFK